MLKGGKDTAISLGFSVQKSRWKTTTFIEYLLFQGLRHRACVALANTEFPVLSTGIPTQGSGGSSPLMCWEAALTTVQPTIIPDCSGLWSPDPGSLTCPTQAGRGSLQEAGLPAKKWHLHKLRHLQVDGTASNVGPLPEQLSMTAKTSCERRLKAGKTKGHQPGST